jgi:hypothetical protein
VPVHAPMLYAVGAVEVSGDGTGGAGGSGAGEEVSAGVKRLLGERLSGAGDDASDDDESDGEGVESGARDVSGQPGEEKKKKKRGNQASSSRRRARKQERRREDEAHSARNDAHARSNA